MTLRTGLLALLFAVPATGQGLTPEQLNHIKAASVYIIMLDQGRGATGSGFVVKNDGDDTYIVTNDHVVNFEHERMLKGAEPSGKSKPQVRVVFDSGTPKERSVKATIVAANPEVDLAVLKVTKVKDAPKPLNLADPPPLMETMPLYVCGFPFGEQLAENNKNPEITITRGSVSSVRKDAGGRISTIQIDASLNPGNSGGPVVAADGKLIGVAARSLLGKGIGLAVPQQEVTRLLGGHPGRVRLVPKDGGGDMAQLRVTLHDPLNRIKSVTAHYRDGQPEMPKKDGMPAIMPDAKKVPLTIDMNLAVGDVTTKGKLVVQLEIEHADGKLVTTPQEIGVTAAVAGGPTPNPEMLVPPDASGRLRWRLRDGREVELPATPLKSRPKSGPNASDLSDLNRKPDNYHEKAISIEGLSPCQLRPVEDGFYEISVLTEAGNAANNIRVLLPKDLALQVAEVYIGDALDFSYALRLDGTLRKPSRGDVHPFEVRELHFLNEEAKPVTSLKAEVAAPSGKPTLSIVSRFPGDFKGKTVTLDAYLQGVDNASREPALMVAHANSMPVLNLKFYASRDLVSQVETDMPRNGATARIECLVEGVDPRKGHGVLGVTSIELLDAQGKPLKTLSSKEKINFPTTPAPKAAIPSKPMLEGSAIIGSDPGIRRAPATANETAGDNGNLILYIGLGAGAGFVALALGAYLMMRGGKPGKPASKYQPKAETSTPVKASSKPAATPRTAAAKPKAKPPTDDNPFANFQ